ncbi:hypothetical protein V1264_005326 [Littorina saxatilis]
MNQPTKGRLKRSSFVQHSRILERRDPEVLDHMPRPIPSVMSVPSWKRDQLPTICQEVPGVAGRDSQSEPERKMLTLEHINTKYPEEQWTHVYTDGSAAEATRDGGGGVYIRYNHGEAHITLATGKYSTNFKAETEAIRKAAEEIKANLPRTKSKVVIFTDALSVLSALHNPRKKDLNELAAVLVSFTADTELTLQWVPAHCGIHGNEQADSLANKGSQLEQEDRQVSYSEEKTVIKALSKKKWKQQHPNFNQSDCYYQLSKRDQVTRFRLRTGHNRLNAHMYSKFRIGESEMCSCNADIMNAEHLLQNCRLHDAPRQASWPEPVPLRVKLFGGLEDLQRTAAFVRAIGISI